MRGKEVFAKTVYGEARGESSAGMAWVAWVIKNRAHKGNCSIRDVCWAPNQFECWDGVDDIEINEYDVYKRIKHMTDRLYDAPQSRDVTGGCDHYNNPAKEGFPSWTRNCERVRTVGNHVFYRSFD